MTTLYDYIVPPVIAAVVGVVGYFLKSFSKQNIVLAGFQSQVKAVENDVQELRDAQLQSENCILKAVRSMHQEQLAGYEYLELRIGSYQQPFLNLDV